MARPASRQKSAVAQALIELRHRLGETQQSMAVRLGTTVTSVASWESASKPGGVMLMNFWLLAREQGYKDLTKVLQRALQELERAERRKADDWLRQHERWMKLKNSSAALEEIANQLLTEGHPCGSKLAHVSAEIASLAKAGWSRSWESL